MSNLQQYLPSIYDNNLQMNMITKVDERLVDEVIGISEQERDNSFVSTSNLEGIKRFEEILGILGDSNTETLEFRKQRALNRLASSPPFTMEYLAERLDAIIGPNNYNVILDTENYTLYVESAAQDQAWYQEILVTINRIKPANIVFINTPLISLGIGTAEQIELSSYEWNYVLGVSWVLGTAPFKSARDMEVIKMASTRSIGTNLLNNLAAFAAEDITQVRINGQHIISNFITKASTNNTTTVEYEVSTTLGIDSITLVELLDKDSNVLTSAAVYVPLVDDVMLKHTLMMKEA